MEMITNFLLLTLKLSTPIVLGAMCGTLAERGGIILLGVEGLMLIGAFAGALGSHLTGLAGMGLLFAVAVGAFFGFIYGLFCIKFKAHQSVVGVGINFFSSGITAVLLKVVWKTEGLSGPVATIANINIPILKDIPIIGAFFRNQSPYLFIMLVIVSLVWVFFYKTKAGLRFRAIGDHPYAVQTAGVHVNRYRYLAMITVGIVAGLAGSYLSISQNNLFVVDMVAGRGFMGLAANIFGGWTPLGSLFAGLVFAIAQALRFYLSDIEIPLQFVQMIPYVSTILILLVVGKKARAPEALGKLIE